MTFRRWLDLDVGLDPYSLQLTPVGVAHIMTGKADVDAARQDEGRDVAVRAVGRAAHEGHIGR